MDTLYWLWKTIKMTLNSLEVLHSLLTVEQVIWLSALYYTRTATRRFITKMYVTKIETLSTLTCQIEKPDEIKVTLIGTAMAHLK